MVAHLHSRLRQREGKTTERKKREKRRLRKKRPLYGGIARSASKAETGGEVRMTPLLKRLSGGKRSITSKKRGKGGDENAI